VQSAVGVKTSFIYHSFKLESILMNKPGCLEAFKELNFNTLVSYEELRSTLSSYFILANFLAR
jgi:hypothetical protein